MTEHNSPGVPGQLPAGLEIRTLTAEDTSATVDLYQSLDERDGYLRFFATPPRDLRTLLEKLAAHDADHLAVGAFDAGELIGVANLVVLDDPNTAEIALVVRHDHQLHGVGTALLRTVATMAERRGMKTLVAEVLLENVTMTKIIGEIGLPTRRTREGTAMHFEITLPTDNG